MKILVIRFSSIGDIVLTSPVLRCLKQQLNAEIHFLTKEKFARILEANPFVDRIIPLKKKLGSLLSDLKQERYDWVIDLHHNWRSARVKWTLQRPSRSFNKLNLEKWLLVNFKINRLPAVHIVDRYLQTVQHLAVCNDGKGLDYFIPKAEEVKVSELNAHLEAGQYIVFNIGANHATKRLPVEKIATICQDLEEPVVLLGGPAEVQTGDQIVELAGSTKLVNLCGQLSLHQSASVVRQAAKVITHDSGMMHIAAAFNKEIVSVWGNTVPEFGMYPYYPAGLDQNTTMEVKDLSCRPCSKIGFEHCPKGHFRCMNGQNLAKIKSALK